MANNESESIKSRLSKLNVAHLERVNVNINKSVGVKPTFNQNNYENFEPGVTNPPPLPPKPQRTYTWANTEGNPNHPQRAQSIAEPPSQWRLPPPPRPAPPSIPNRPNSADAHNGLGILYTSQSALANTIYPSTNPFAADINPPQIRPVAVNHGPPPIPAVNHKPPLIRPVPPSPHLPQIRPVPPDPSALQIRPVPVTPYQPQIRPRQANLIPKPAVPPAPVNETCLACQYFDNVDSHAAKFPRQNVISIPNLALNLTSPFPTKAQKARAIFVWLHHNVAYDTVSFFGGNVRCKTPEETLRTGLAVCQGYAELFAELALHCGLEAIVISGHGKGYGYRQNTDGVVPRFNSNHAWNAVRLGPSGEWHLIDPCWGAGYVDGDKFVKCLSTKHFTSSPEVFRQRHYPTNPKEQFCSTTMSWEEYIMMKDGPLLYGQFEQHGFSEETISPKFRKISPDVRTFMITTKCTHKGIPTSEQHVLLLYVNGNYTPFQVNSTGTIWTCQTPSPLVRGTQVNVYILDKFNGKDAKGISAAEYLSRTRGGCSWSFGGLCMWEVS